MPRFYKGHDNDTKLFFTADVTQDDGSVVRDAPVRFARADNVVVTLRQAQVLEGQTAAPDITFDSLNPPEPATFYRDDQGLLGVRFGDVPNTVVGTLYHARIVVVDIDNPDGFVVCSYGDDAENPTLELLCS